MDNELGNILIDFREQFWAAMEWYTDLFTSPELAIVITVVLCYFLFRR